MRTALPFLRRDYPSACVRACARVVFSLSECLVCAPAFKIPYDYYSLPFCHPRIHEESENLGERLSGDRIENSLYKLNMKSPQVAAHTHTNAKHQ